MYVGLNCFKIFVSLISVVPPLLVSGLHPWSPFVYSASRGSVLAPTPRLAITPRSSRHLATRQLAGHQRPGRACRGRTLGVTNLRGSSSRSSEARVGGDDRTGQSRATRIIDADYQQVPTVRRVGRGRALLRMRNGPPVHPLPARRLLSSLIPFRGGNCIR